MKVEVGKYNQERLHKSFKKSNISSVKYGSEYCQAEGDSTLNVLESQHQNAQKSERIDKIKNISALNLRKHIP